MTGFRRRPHPVITDIKSLVNAAIQLHKDMDAVSAELFDRRHTPDPRGVNWWDTRCSAAVTVVRSTPYGPERRQASAALSATVTQVKRDWAQAALDSSSGQDLWSVARWRHGRRISHIPPLMIEGSLCHDPERMADSFRKRFFSAAPTHVSPSQPDDPPPLPERPYIPVSEDEIRHALASTSNKSAPGLSGINYKLLKWAFAAAPHRFTSLFDACLRLGHHPWHDALVVIIPKPNKPDYSIPKAYRPISLLECCAKLVEKIVARRFLSDINHLDLLPRTQFGSRDYSSPVDAILAITHKAETVIKSKYVGAMILFDIQGFFDNISIPRLLRICTDLGFPTTICAWLESFLSDRHIRFSFNNFKSDYFTVNHGTPQGSPLSPILSALFTSPLLRLTERWSPSRSLSMFVDDGSIFAAAPTFLSATRLACSGFEEVLGWLHRNGLRADREKTEFITFFPPRPSAHLGHLDDVASIMVHDPLQGNYPVRRSTVVRYLGAFLHQRLDWTHHAKIMAARARSTVRALNILGNSIRGLSFANWRRVYHSIVLPILTYAFPAWFSPRTTKKVLNIFQVAQNDAVRKISGCFRTTPIEPLHLLVGIPPISFTLQKLRETFGERLLRLPPSSPLHTLRSFNPLASWSADYLPRSTLTLFPPIISSSFSFPNAPYAQHESWDRLTLSYVRPEKDARDQARHLLLHPPSTTLSIIIRLLPIPSPPFISSFCVRHGERVVVSGWHSGADVVRALFESLVSGLEASHAFGHILIFIPNKSLLRYLLDFSKHRFLPFSRRLRAFFSSFFTNAQHSAEILWFSTRWSSKALDRVFEHLAEEAQLVTLPSPPSFSPAAKAIAAWAETYTSNARRSFYSTVPPDPACPQPPPFIRGALAHGNRRYSSAAFQIATGHGFFADYSDSFRAQADDNTTCPCGEVFNIRPVRHSLEHVLFRCPLHSNPRARHLGGYSSLRTLLSSEDGGHRLVKFLHYTQALLRPLPPRPDPP